MAYRFQVSRYKNVSPKVPKKEQCITEIPLGKVMSSCGNFVTCSTKHIAFNIESGGGGCAGVLPLSFSGRRNRNVPTVYAHGEFLNDMTFSPYDDDLLVTCSNDGTIKLWDIPESFDDILDKPISIITPDETTTKLEMLNFHPLADEVIACSAFDAIHYIDLNSGETQTCVENGNQQQFQSMSWRWDGRVMVTSAKDCKNRIIDPRIGSITTTFNGTECNKDSRVVWLGDTDYILGSGFNKARSRIVCLWDVRKTSSLLDEQESNVGSGVMIPFHDIDTNLLILAGKGDQSVHLYEFRNDIVTLQYYSTESLQEQTFGMGLAPKRILNVMEGEVARAFQLSKNMITPLPYIIPRKSYREFHADLFPDTVYTGKATMNAVEWFSGQNKEAEKLSLDPNERKDESCKRSLDTKNQETSSFKSFITPKNNDDAEREITEKLITTSTQKKKFGQGLKNLKKANETVKQSENEVECKVKKAGFVPAYQSKFKHIFSEAMHKSNNIENIVNLAENLPSESDAFQGCRDFLAFPISGVAGRIGIVQMSKPCRLPDADLPVIQNGCSIADFAINPFDHRNLAVGCEDWKIRLWRIPEDGLSETLQEPCQILTGHQQRVTIVRYHPTAENILVSASMDNTVRVWDLKDFSEIGILEGHTNQILCLAWHPDGKYLATYCKDQKIRIYDPVEDVEVLKEGPGPDVIRGARICWCGPRDNWLAVTVVNRDGRMLYVYSSETFEVLVKHEVDNSPSVLGIHYDESSSVLFATGKGDRIIHAFEINDIKPKLHVLSPIKVSSVLQGISLYQKNLLNIKSAEIARLICLKKTNIEYVSVFVPRIKLDYFQDDIFSDIRVSWEAAMTGEEWLEGELKKPKTISLQPMDMKRLSDAPKEAPKTAKYSSRDILSAKTDEEKKTELINAMVSKLDFDDRLEQDNFEGVDEDEWDD